MAIKGDILSKIIFEETEGKILDQIEAHIISEFIEYNPVKTKDGSYTGTYKDDYEMEFRSILDNAQRPIKFSITLKYVDEEGRNQKHSRSFPVPVKYEKLKTTSQFKKLIKVLEKEITEIREYLDEKISALYTASS